MNFDFMVPALATKSSNSDTGTVRKNKKTISEKGGQIQSPISMDEASSKSHDPDKLKQRLNGEERAISPASIQPNINLSRDELLKLLSVFEGELQARDEVISILKTECSQNSDSRYGFTSTPLKALQRDAATLEVTSQDHVCEQTKEQLRKIIQHQKDSYRKLKQMHLASEEKYQRLSAAMEDEKQKHQGYILKSDDFVNLLEHDRDRIKHLLEQEKTVHERKERELTWKIKENKEELARMKTLSLELVEERQQQLQALNEQKQLATTLQQNVDELQSKIKEAEITTKAEKEHSAQLENELEEQTNNFYKDYEALNTKLTAEVAKSKQQEEKIKSLGRQMKKLKCVDKNLRKTDDQLWRIKERLEQEESYDDLLEEVELLRKTVAGMQEAEKIYTQAQEEAKELQEAMEKELVLTAAVRNEVKTLRNGIRNKTDVERCVEEGMFRLDEVQEQFKAEQKKVNKMNKQIEEFRERLTKMDESENLLQMSEIKLEQLCSVAREKKQAEADLRAKLQLEKEKTEQFEEMVEDERIKVTEVTQKMIEESKKVLKLKENLAALETKRIEESGLLRRKLELAEASISQMITKEKAGQMEALINNLRKQVAMLKKRLDQLENEGNGSKAERRITKDKSEKPKENRGKNTTKSEHGNAIKMNKSTEKLSRLLEKGSNEKATATGHSEDTHSRYSALETTNATLQEEVKSLQLQLQESISLQTNKNNNNIALKGVSICHAASQTVEAEDKKPTPRRNHTPVRRLSSSPHVAATDSKPSLRRTSSSTRREMSAGRTSTNAVTTLPRAQLRGATTSSRKSSTGSQAARSTSGLFSDASKTTKPLLTRVKSSEDNKSSSRSPVSLTITHDPLEETAPNFRIIKDEKTGSQHIEATVSDSKKNTHVKTSSKTRAVSSPTQSRPPSASSVNGRSLKTKVTGKVTSKVSMTPTPKSRTRSESKTKISDPVERRSSVSPTRIPKFRSCTSAPTSPATTRTSRSSKAPPTAT